MLPYNYESLFRGDSPQLHMVVLHQAVESLATHVQLLDNLRLVETVVQPSTVMGVLLRAVAGGVGPLLMVLDDAGEGLLDLAHASLGAVVADHLLMV
jgi:hypothetical protein